MENCSQPVLVSQLQVQGHVFLLWHRDNERTLAVSLVSLSLQFQIREKTKNKTLNHLPTRFKNLANAVCCTTPTVSLPRPLHCRLSQASSVLTVHLNSMNCFLDVLRKISNAMPALYRQRPGLTVVFCPTLTGFKSQSVTEAGTAP